MNNIGITTTAFANFVAPLNPAAKQPVGQEDAEAKGKVLPPVVEGEQGASLQNRDNPNKAVSTGLENNPEAVASKSDEEGSGKNPQQEGRSNSEAEQDRADKQLIQELAARDREVRSHEQAHANVGGVYAGSPSYTYQRGPNGVNYAVAGEVPISIPSNLTDPRQALSAAEQVQRAALAPAEPSAQDLRVAAQAAQMAIQARADIAAEQSQQRNEQTEKSEQQRAELKEESDLRSERLDSLREQMGGLDAKPAPGSIVDNQA